MAKQNPFAKMKKNDDEEEGAEHEAAESKGEEEQEEAEEKSLLTEDSLQKSLDRLTALSKSETQTSRKEALLQKALTKSLTQGENAELHTLLGGGASKDSLAKSVTSTFADNDKVQKALDVSEYLEGQHESLTKSLETLADALEKSDNRQHEFNVVLAKAVSQIGALVKGVSGRLGVIEQQPSRGPKAALGGRKPLEKSFANQDGSSRLSRDDILKSMEAMNIDSLQKGGEGRAPCGEDLTEATAKYETTMMLSKALLGDIQSFRARGN